MTFADVAGVDEAKEEVKEIVDFLREPARFAAIGGRIPKCVLLVGPPGTGKTLLARSIAGEAKAPFLFTSGSDFVEMYAGVGAARIRKLFRDGAAIDRAQKIGERHVRHLNAALRAQNPDTGSEHDERNGRDDEKMSTRPLARKHGELQADGITEKLSKEFS